MRLKIYGSPDSVHNTTHAVVLRIQGGLVCVSLNSQRVLLKVLMVQACECYKGEFIPKYHRLTITLVFFNLQEYKDGKFLLIQTSSLQKKTKKKTELLLHDISWKKWIRME